MEVYGALYATEESTAAHLAFTEECFRNADSNQDGLLTKEECIAFGEAVEAKMIESGYTKLEYT